MAQSYLLVKLARLARVQAGLIRYNSPWTQVVILGFVTFGSVGMFSAVSGLGAGGTQDTQLSDTANSVLYGVFAIGGFFAGSIHNILGPRVTLLIGTTGYSIYIGALWSYQVHRTRWFLILSGAVLGATAALLWSAQGAIMMSYPLEKDKGRSFTIFWTLFQMGTLTGAAIALGIEANSDLPAVSNGVYLTFMIIILMSIFTSWLLLPPHLVVRGDGTVPLLEKAISPRQEFAELMKLFKDWRTVALFPMFISSNYFYAYQGAITVFLFNARTRALISLLTGLGSIFGSILIGVLTDNLPGKRRTRALASTAVVFVLTCILWCYGIYFQGHFDRGSVSVGGIKVPWDWTFGVAAGPIILLMAYYIADASYQGLAYYTMSAMTNDPFKLARMAGYYKGVQSAGAGISFGMDATKTAFLTEIIVSWTMLFISLPLCAAVLWSIRDSNYDVETTIHVEGAPLRDVAVPPSRAKKPEITATATDKEHVKEDGEFRRNPDD